MKKILTLSIAALLSSGVYAQADSPSGSTNPEGTTSPPSTGQEAWTPAPGASSGETTAGISFSDVDSNKDGYISKEEAQELSKLAENMDKYDQNADQQLDQSEFAQFETEIQQEGSQMQEQPGTPPSGTSDPSSSDPSSVDPSSPGGAGGGAGGGM